MPLDRPGTPTQEAKMYNHDGHDLFVIDGHMHFWDANPENWKNKYGESWIKCFYAYHSSLSPAEAVWSFDKFCRYGAEALVDDLFRNGYVDMAILNSTYLYEFYKNGFNSHAQNNIVKTKYPDRLLLCGSFDPREEESGFDAFRRMVAEYPVTTEPHGRMAQWLRGWRLNDPWAYRYLSLAEELGIKNIHVHKGPTVYPLSADAFDVHDVDYAATDFPDLNFIVEHVGLPRLDDFCWIAAQESNVYAGLSVAMAFVHLRPRYFAEILANLLFWLGPDKLCFGSDYAIWSPKWLIEKFMAFELPEDLKQEYHVDLTFEIKRKILGENTARLYEIDIPAQTAKLSQDGIGSP
jgi:predicted TIM-barrel fold metal-dependent hydrolase